MLSERKAVATIAVKDARAARDFSVGKLGLKEVDRGRDSVLTLESGGSKTFVYESRFAGTNKATAATWTVGEEIDSIVRDLKRNGVPFEHYEMPNTKLEGDVHVSGRMRVAWFKDPDGDILSLVNG
jgi:catechol 2,3-dioxygenase-like lactoylglutathione lyase family enzyme